MDIYWYVNPSLKGYTYIHSSDNMHNSIIDYILTCTALAEAATCSLLVCCPAPDHRALTAHLEFSKDKRGKGYWKLNNDLLKEESYVVITNSDISHTINMYQDCISKQKLLELIKVIVIETSIAYSTIREKEKTL